MGVLVVVEAGAAAGASLTGNAATGSGRWPGVLDWVRQNPWLAFGGFTLGSAAGLRWQMDCR